MARPKSVTIKVRGRGFETAPAAEALVRSAVVGFNNNEAVESVEVASNQEGTVHIVTITAKGYVERDSGPRSAVGMATAHVNKLLEQGADTRGPEMQTALRELKEARDAAKSARATGASE
jgi:hypothetical protein